MKDLKTLYHDHDPEIPIRRTSFWLQLRGLIWKNYLVKMHNKKDLIFEFLVPIVITGIAIAAKKFIRDYNNLVVYFVAYLISGNCCRFTLSQLSREKELKISKALSVMNVQHAAVNLSYLIIQLPLSLFSGLLIMVCDGI